MAVPLVEVPGQPVVGGVHAHRDVVLLHLGPERVEFGKRERAEAPQAGHGGRSDQDELGAPFGDPVELLDGLVHDGQGDHRCGEDPVLVVERPLLVHPLVERVHHGVGGLGIGGETLLQHAGQGRPHDGAVESLFVHELEARSGLEEGLRRPHGLTEDLAAALPLRVPVLEEVLLRTRLGHDAEGRVRDVLRDDVLDGQLVATVDLHELDQVAVLGRQVPGEGIGLLVHVVVCVEDGEVESVRHGGSSCRDRGLGVPAVDASGSGCSTGQCPGPCGRLRRPIAGPVNVARVDTDVNFESVRSGRPVESLRGRRPCGSLSYRNSPPGATKWAPRCQ